MNDRGSIYTKEWVEGYDGFCSNTKGGIDQKAGWITSTGYGDGISVVAGEKHI